MTEARDLDIALARTYGLPTRLCRACGRITRHVDTALHRECERTYTPRPIPTWRRT